MTDTYINDPDVIVKYGLESGKTFEEQFSVVSLENIWFFIVATAVWLFGYKQLVQHKTDVANILRENKAHRPIGTHDGEAISIWLRAGSRY